MPRIWRPASLIVVTALLVIGTSLPLRAIDPAGVVFYGGDLREPVLNPLAIPQIIIRMNTPN